MTSLTNMVHHGMIYVPPGYITPATQFDLTEVRVNWLLKQYQKNIVRELASPCAANICNCLESDV
jgi:hypothetical protein